MKLYHGTSADLLNEILSTGIKPRPADQPSRWEEFPSRVGFTYLAIGNAPYYAAVAAAGHKSVSNTALVLEVDTDRLDQAKLYPDEDYIVEALSPRKTHSVTIPAHDATVKWLEAGGDAFCQHLWKDSIEQYGTAAYKGVIPPAAITRYATWDLRKLPLLTLRVLDWGTGMLAHQMFKGERVGTTAWLFGDRQMLPDGWADPISGRVEQDGTSNHMPADIRNLWNQRRQAIEVMSKNRESIQVVTHHGR
jgi:hypothetical protein